MPEQSVGSSGEHNRQPADPTELTTAAILREIANLSDRINLKIEGVVNALTARLDAIDKATDKFEENLVRVPTETQKAVGHLQELMDNKFAGIAERLAAMQLLKDEQFSHIQQQFVERDVRATNETEAGRQSVAAALQAAKEAVGKSEAAVAKSIEQQSSQIRTVTDANNAQIADIKERLTRIEAIAIGQASQKQETTQSAGMSISVITTVIAVVSLAIAAFAVMR